MMMLSYPSRSLQIVSNGIRCIVALKSGKYDECVQWGSRAITAFGPMEDDCVLTMSFLDIAVHVLEAMRRLGKGSEVERLRVTVIRQSTVSRDGRGVSCGTNKFSHIIVSPRCFLLYERLGTQVWPLAAYFLVKQATRTDFLLPGPGLVLPFPSKKLFRRRAFVPEPVQPDDVRCCVCCGQRGGCACLPAQSLLTGELMEQGSATSSSAVPPLFGRCVCDNL